MRPVAKVLPARIRVARSQALAIPGAGTASSSSRATAMARVVRVSAGQEARTVAHLNELNRPLDVGEFAGAELDVPGGFHCRAADARFPMRALSSRCRTLRLAHLPRPWTSNRGAARSSRSLD